MKMALFRLVLISIPLFFLVLATLLVRSQSESVIPIETLCSPFLFGLSASFLKEDKNFNTPYYPFASEPVFFRKANSARWMFKKNKISSSSLLLTLPLFLTKDQRWIVSKKSFIISQNLERKEISHLDYQTLKNLFVKFHNDQMLNLKSILKKYPTSSLLLKLDGKNDENILAGLELLKNHGGSVYIFSSKESLLQQISNRYPQFLLLHSFKRLIRFQLLTFLPIFPRIPLPGNGLLIPHALLPSDEIISSIYHAKKILFLEDLPRLPSKGLAESANGWLASDLQVLSKFIKYKRDCLIDLEPNF